MSDQKSIVVRNQAPVVRSMDDVERAAAAMSKSGYFQDAKDAAQSIVKILAGQEMGFGPFASMTGIYIIQGRPSIGANLMAAAVKSSGRYNYRVIEMTDAVCEIAFFEQGQECGRSRFTIEDARKAQTKNLDKFPRNMLFARAMSNGCRWFTPDIFAGAPTYTPEELGANINEAGDMIDIMPTTYTPQPEKTITISRQDEITQELGFEDTVTEAKPAKMNIGDAMNELSSDGTPYGGKETADLVNRLNAMRKAKGGSSEKPEHSKKMLAIQTILEARNGK